MVYAPPAVPILAAIAGRDAEAVRALWIQARIHGLARLVADPSVQLLDNGGPNDVHAEPCFAAAGAGKRVLCEKPLGRTAAEARARAGPGYRSALHASGWRSRGTHPSRTLPERG
jgi:predicted dehydrogenase